ncbi:hypothetical protein [Streptomyces sp. NPDC089919]|uniref:hypothetical protein n=1 Tax=Streptomyces sp. NPDC089919 TaxID=3155188 RepID=UPI0034336076
MAEVGGWIWERNLRPFLELLSSYLGYGFDGTDWETVASAVASTDDERPDGWYSYPLAGEQAQVVISLARAAAGDELMATVSGDLPPELQVRTDTLLAAFATG